MPERKLLGAAAVLATTAAVGGCGGEPAGEWESTDEAQSPVVVCADETVEGIDVSYYQGQVSWPEVASSGRTFAIARINHGTFMDPEFDANWVGMRDAGLIRGAYQYFEPGDDVAYQAQVVIDRVGVLGPGDLPVTIDVETTGGVGPLAIEAAVGEWMELVEAGTGKRPMIYTGKYFWNDNVASEAFQDAMLWIAAYGPPCPDTPDAWTDWSFWQYSSTGTVDGIAGDVDLNVFNGSKALLETLSGIIYRGEVLDLDAPLTMEVGTEAIVRIEIENTGYRIWDESTRLGTTEPRDRDSVFRADDWIGDNRPAQVDAAIAPGEVFVFEFTLVAPEIEGTYVEHFGLVQEGVTWFADELGGGPPDDAIALTVEVVEAGSAGSGTGGEGGGGELAVASAGEPDGSGCAVRPGRLSSDGGSAGKSGIGMGWLAALWIMLRRASRQARRASPRRASRRVPCRE
jgi:lysozyme